MKILISGAGVGGLALAAFLKEEPGVECVIIDKAKEWKNDGFAIALWKNGRDMLAKLGLQEKFDAGVTAFKRICIHDGEGKEIRNYELSRFDVEVGMSIGHVSRHSLHEWLLFAAGVPVRMGIYITELKEEHGGVEVVFSDGTRGTFDLVVGADGLHSQVRALTTGMEERFIGWRAWWFWTAPKFCGQHTISEYVAPGTYIMLSNEGDRTLAIFMAHADHAKWDDEAGRIERMKNTFKEASAIVPGIFDGISDKDALPSDVTEIELPYWRTGRTVLLGDAAHAMAPFIALGASMALEDAYVLAGELSKLPENLERALKNYEEKRMPRVRKVKELTERMRMISAVTTAWWRKVINVVIPLVPQNAAMRDYLSLMEEKL